ncbi:MAG: acyl-CoA dehydrogenase family protein [Acidimicrobiales bacterium]|jgi:alkylation response protein AidB-like acyl-CoA dehydrogenase|nr:acyl-CoA dehydrogenase family protein [Acidimicrobiales bacterium]
MDWSDTPEEAAFRAELRGWLAAHAPAPVGPDADERMAQRHAWHEQLYAAGYIGLSFPAEVGGRGLPATFEAILNDELGAGGHPPPPPIGHLSNALRLYATEEQRARWLRPMLSGEERWCQGFSEPGAGSDLVSLSTRAELVGEGAARRYRIHGQKVWTSEALWADWCFLLARTEADVPPHRAISVLIVPLDAPGVEMRPIVTSAGAKEFAEVFFDGAEVPESHRIGAPGQGWPIAMALLGYERGPADVGWVARLTKLLADAEADVRSGRLQPTAVQQQALARAWVHLRALQVHVQRRLSDRLDGSVPGPEGSLDKLLMTTSDQLLSRVLYELRGAAAVLDETTVMDPYLWSRAQSIFGGTQQIQRNIVAQRVLGLPR